MKTHILISVLCLAGQALLAQYAQQNYPMVLELGRLPSGARVSFQRELDRNYYMFTIGIGGGASPSILSAPARIEVYRADDDIRQLTAGYKTVQKTATGIDARLKSLTATTLSFMCKTTGA